MLVRNDALKMISIFEVEHINNDKKMNILLDYWFVFEDENIELNDDLKKILIENDFSDITEYSNFFDEVVVIGTIENNKIYSNIYISKKLIEYLGISDDVEGDEKNNLYKCPCCGFYSLKKKSEYEICRICKWEDDGSEESIYSFSNKDTLHDFRSAFFKNNQYSSLKQKFIFD